MINTFIYPDANELHERMCEKLMLGDNSEEVDWDWAIGTEVGLHNVALGAESFKWDFDLKRLWMPKSRWNMMIRQYLDPEAVEQWLAMVEDRLTGRGRGIAVLRTNLVQGKGVGRGVRRRWGSCMLNISYRANPRPTVSLHSRTTYFGYLAAMDITVAHTLARYVGAIVGVDPAEMQFVWTLDLAQFHGFRSLAWPLGDPELKAQMDADLPDRTAFPAREGSAGYRKALDGYARLVKSDDAGKPYGEEAFSSFARVRRRFHAEVIGHEFSETFAGGFSRNQGSVKPFAPLPSVPSSTLDLSPIGLVLE